MAANNVDNNESDKSTINEINKPKKKLALLSGALVLTVSLGVGAIGGSMYAQFTDTNRGTPNKVVAGNLSINITDAPIYLTDNCDPNSPSNAVTGAAGVYNIDSKATRLWMKIPVKVTLPNGWGSSKLNVGTNGVMATIDSPGSTLASKYTNIFDVSQAFLMDSSGNKFTAINSSGTYDLYIPAGVNIESYAGNSWPKGSKINVNKNTLLVEFKQQ